MHYGLCSVSDSNWLGLDQAAYPHFDIYPAVPTAEKDSNMDNPNFNLYPSSHASLPTTTDTRAPIVVRLPAVYPAFDFCGSVVRLKRQSADSSNFDRPCYLSRKSG